MQHNDTIRQGATFYREGEAFATANLSIAQMLAMTLRSTLVGTDIALPCSWIGDGTRATFAWTMPRDVSATLDAARVYQHNIDIYDEVNTYEIANGSISVRVGQKPV